MTVLVAWNATAASDRAVATAAEFAEERGTSLHIVHCFEHEPGDSPTAARRDIEAIDERERALELLARRLRSTDLVVTTSIEHGLTGSVADRILATADDQDATLIVVGAEPRSTLANVVLGSATSEVVARAECPVVSVRAS